jgi:hypothetical protein
MWLDGPVRQIGLSHRPAKLGIDSWVYKFGLRSFVAIYWNDVNHTGASQTCAVKIKKAGLCKPFLHRILQKKTHQWWDGKSTG